MSWLIHVRYHWVPYLISALVRVVYILLKYILHSVYRTQILSFAIDFPWNEWDGSKIEWNYLFRRVKIDIGRYYIAMVHLLLFHVFHHRFAIWIAMPNEVRFDQFHWPRNYRFKSMKIKWSIEIILFSVHLLRLPFNWRTPLGYLIASAIQYVMLLHASMIGANIVSLTFGCYFFAVAITKCFKCSLFAICQSTASETNRTCIWKQLLEFVEFQSRVEKLSSF